MFVHGWKTVENIIPTLGHVYLTGESKSINYNQMQLINFFFWVTH
jgi:hypothetical protein